MHLFNYLQSSSLLFYFTIGLIGLVVGSFLNVVIYRLPQMMRDEWHRECRELLKISGKEADKKEAFNLVVPGSHCPQCGHKITVLQNIPVISYLFLRGKCSACHTPISIHYPIIELLSAILAIIVAWNYGYGLHALLACLLTWALLTLSFIDYDCQLLPDDITLSFLWLGLLINLFHVFTDTHSSLIGAMTGYGGLWLVYIAFKLVTGKEGMGYGDFKLLSMLGAWLGWQMLPLIIMLSSVCGAVIGIGLILFGRHDKNIPIPFGPYLALAGWIALLWGTTIMEHYNQWATP